MEDASGKTNCLLELAIPEIYIISELTVLNLYSDTDLTVPKVEAAGQDLIQQCEYHTVVLGKPREHFRRLDDPLIQLSAPPDDLPSFPPSAERRIPRSNLRRVGVLLVYNGLSATLTLPNHLRFYLQRAAFYKWAMLGNQPPPPCKFANVRSRPSLCVRQIVLSMGFSVGRRRSGVRCVLARTGRVAVSSWRCTNATCWKRFTDVQVGQAGAPCLACGAPSWSNLPL